MSQQAAARLVLCVAPALCSLHVVPLRATATDYAFSTIYSGAGAQILDGAINNSGTVMFERTLAGVTGLYTGIGGPLTTMVDTTQTTTLWYPGSYGDSEPGYYITAQYPTMFAPTIDDSGRVLFIATIGYPSLFASTGGTTVELSDLGPGGISAFSSTGHASVHYANSGVMTIGRNNGLEQRGIVMNTLATPSFSPEPQLPRYALPVSPVGGLNGTAINNSGGLAAYSPFTIGTATGGDVIVKYEAGAWVTATDFALNDLFFSIDSYAEVPGLNNLGDALYVGPSLSPGGRQLLLYHNGSVSILSDGLHGLTSFRSLGINDKGALVFTAIGPTRALGVYWGPDAADKVVAIGGALDGSFVTGLTLFNRSINNDGLIAFSATLADGRSGVYTAAPIPEPSTFVLCVLATVALLATRRLDSSALTRDVVCKSHKNRDGAKPFCA